MADWSAPGYAAIARVLQDAAGLSFPPGRYRQVEIAAERGLRRAGERSLAGYAARLKRDGAARDELIAELTVGETYFFREPRQFEFIAREVVPDLLRRPRTEAEPLRAWSGGCAEGEEAYSLAILFRQLGLSDRTRVLGTDISRPRLAAARRGVYRRWSLRGVQADIIDRYFRERGGRFELVPEIRSAVEFRYLNLAEDSYPSLSTGVWGMDLILCRNVLIYFDRETIARVAPRLVESLADDGWLFLAASDPPLAEYVECETVPTGAGVAYRKPGRRARFAGLAAADAAARAAAPLERAGREERGAREPWIPAAGQDVGAGAEGSRAPAREPTWYGVDEAAGSDHAPASSPEAGIAEAYANRDYDRVVELAEAALERGAGSADVWVAWVRALANQGRLEDADRVCTRALERHPTSAELVYLHAILLTSGGRVQEAAAAARRALYLDRGMVAAHMALGHALARAGNAAGAARAYRAAERMLLRLPPDAPVPAADGETAERLLQILRVQLRLLGEAA